MKLQKPFTGRVKYISMSPHGDPEALVLEDGAFIRTPPHSLQDKDLLVVGAEISGQGELIGEEPNAVYHHAKVLVGGMLAADDSLTKEAREKLNETHNADLKRRQDAPSKECNFQGKLVAVGTKPKGEVDRLIFDDGTSVHLAKESDLEARDIALGDNFEIAGESRVYGKNRFVKAHFLRHL